MNKLSKVVMLAATVVTMGSLAACQSTTPQEPPARHMMDDGPQGKHFMKRHKLTPEQR
jgi:Spy/CpxP family protein refolding chaperone